MNVFDLIDSAIVEAKTISPVKYEDLSMKSNDVRMQINRDLHAQFKRVNGDTNDERMKKLLDDSKEKYQLIEMCEGAIKSAKAINSIAESYEVTIKRLAIGLVSSIAVSVCSVAYVCVLKGWFHG
ncbi:TMhelix containing protein [Vibrio phage 242E40-1]|nr:TMhelix containing protein [Vibrio phage 242E40-1]